MDAKAQNLTIGELLPANLQANYSAKVLQTPLKEAIDIAKYSQPSSSGLGANDIEEIQSIYKEYLNRSSNVKSSSGSGSSGGYWDKSDQDNEAYWNKNQ